MFLQDIVFQSPFKTCSKISIDVKLLLLFERPFSAFNIWGPNRRDKIIVFLYSKQQQQKKK